MKKILSCALMLLMSAAAVAQRSDGERHWFAGAHIGTNYVVGDNISDHPAFKYFSDAIGMDGGVYVGKYLTPSVGCRLDISYGKAHNRGDVEFVENDKAFVKSFKNNGYYHFNVLQAGADVLYDFTSRSSRHISDPLHVIGVLGLGVWSTSGYKLSQQAGAEMTSAEALKVIAPEGGSTSAYGRLGCLLDYRASDNLSFNLEGNVSVMGDKFDGIDFDEAVDFMFRLQLGATYYF